MKNSFLLRCLPLSLALGAASPALSQTASPSPLQEILAGRSLPLSMVAKDLNEQYRRLSLGSQSGLSDWKTMMIAAKAGVDPGLYFSKGETVVSGGQTYLIAYRPQITIDPKVFDHHHGHGDDNNAKPVGPMRLRPNTPLALSLLNLRTAPSFNDIRPFDAKQDLEAATELDAISVRNLTAVGRGMLNYLNGRGRQTLPELGATLTERTKRTFYPFVHDQRLWLHPATEQPYLPNPAVSKLKTGNVSNAQIVAVFSDPVPGTDGRRAVLFLDGHVERVAAERYQRLMRVKPTKYSRQTEEKSRMARTTIVVSPSRRIMTVTSTVRAD